MDGESRFKSVKQYEIGGKIVSTRQIMGNDNLDCVIYRVVIKSARRELLGKRNSTMGIERGKSVEQVYREYINICTLLN